jgi:hypothetical protein
MIYMIYAPSERPEILPLVEQLSVEYEVCLAPVGYEANSQGWKNLVEQDMQKCKVAVVVLSELSIADASVVWRFKRAKEFHLLILPMFLGDFRPFRESISTEHLGDDSNWFFELMNFQGLRNTQYVIAQVNALTQRGVINKKPHEVFCFFSYSRADVKFAERLALDLRAAGAKTWRDAENIPAGANWDREIEKAIRDSTHVIYIATPASVASENVQDEIGMAVNKSKTVIPVIAETCELPLRVHRAQWVDFREDYEVALAKLCVQLGLKTE